MMCSHDVQCNKQGGSSGSECIMLKLIFLPFSSSFRTLATMKWHLVPLLGSCQLHCSVEDSCEITLKEMHITNNVLESNCIYGEVNNLNKKVE